MHMKHISKLISLCAVAVMACSCYEDYIKDYDYSTIYCAFQYDLRTFVLGEGQKFDFTTGLAGVMQNSQDRKVNVIVNDELVTGNISELVGVDAASFTAYNGLCGSAPFGTLSQAYVTNEVRALGVSALKPLPEEYYTISGLNGMTIKAGQHTASATITATDAFVADPQAIAPYYAIAFQILSADADKTPEQKSFEVIAVKYENKYYGYWYHGGKTIVVDDKTGDIISEEKYPIVLPQDDSKVYTLKTIAPNAVVTNKIGDKSGSLVLTFEDDDKVRVSCTDESIKIVPGSCYTNGAKLLQDRVIYLDYSFSNNNGTTTFVKDELLFRNRIRDGINEWRDENPANYE